MAFSWLSALRLAVGAVLLTAASIALFTLPIEKEQAFWYGIVLYMAESFPANGVSCCWHAFKSSGSLQTGRMLLELVDKLAPMDS